MSPLSLTSRQFGEGGEIPVSAAHPMVGGLNESPQLSWQGEPEATRSFAITCWDPDAPTGVGFSHWIRFDIPPGLHSLDPGAGTEDGEWIDGFTDWGESHYGGMAPPAGDPPHHYLFTVYALDITSTGLDPLTTYAKFRFMTREHVLDSTTLTGTFSVPG